MPNARTTNAVFKWPAARLSLAANREPVRFEDTLTESVPLPHGRGVNRAEAICRLPPALSGAKANWLVVGVNTTRPRRPIEPG